MFELLLHTAGHLGSAGAAHAIGAKEAGSWHSDHNGMVATHKLNLVGGSNEVYNRCDTKCSPFQRSWSSPCRPQAGAPADVVLLLKWPRLLEQELDVLLLKWPPRSSC